MTDDIIDQGPALASYRIPIRVQYKETDGQRRVHHANYPVYFEQGRVEMLRSGGIRYRDLEDAGIYLVVTEMVTRFFGAAEFDDELELVTDLMEIRKVRLRHRYRVYREETLITEGQSVIACVSHEGKPTKLPEPMMKLIRQELPGVVK